MIKLFKRLHKEEVWARHHRVHSGRRVRQCCCGGLNAGVGQSGQLVLGEAEFRTDLKVRQLKLTVGSAELVTSESLD